ncbi:MlaE family lipid ABC transporter permease subunit [Rhizobiales bacterium L72]|uniref:MlaE family lipid ABC transporter permease subunit n=2 Tax=Propylenella binzhouense TaxID=2555902 RepID=A0A964T3H3_9HYPH|nr:MlaE family lipid ABC transporter permease subunit [Propylenella binzhouense]
MRPAGSWVIGDASRIEAALADFAPGAAKESAGTLVIDVSGVSALDTAGAYLLVRLERAWAGAGREVVWQGADPAREALVKRVRDVLAEPVPPVKGRENFLAHVGETMISVAGDGRNLVGMLGGVIREIGTTILHPSTFRATAVVQQMDVAGLRAVPIIMLMSFLIGGILAQQSAFQLRYFGAEIFAVDLVGIIALREIAVLLTAIMVAGRSGSAITAELGSMEMGEEIDALRVMGLDPVNVLVLPRVLALVLVLPLLTFLAAMAALAGALLTLWMYSGIVPDVFLVRLRDAVDFSSLFSGLLKAPFMALIIGCIACAEGMAVRGSAESLGRHTTAAVVKSIFMVIVVDGLFAIFYASIDF